MNRTVQPREPDELTEEGQRYTFRDGQWTTHTGYCVSTSYGHALTQKFYERNGRAPLSEPRPAQRRRKMGTGRAA